MNQEINNELYASLGEDWYSDKIESVALLRRENELKIEWISGELSELKQLNGKRGPRVLDLGCGGGFLSNALAKEGYSVVGLDIHPSVIQVAREHDKTRTVKYVQGDAVATDFPDSSFDVVTVMDLLEHVDRPDQLIEESFRILAPGGVLYFHTFNRNPISWIGGVHLLNRMSPSWMQRIHKYSMFIKPSELLRYCDEAGFQPAGKKTVHGIRPVVNLAFFKLLIQARVAPSLRFRWSHSTAISYAGKVIRPPI